MTKNNLKLLTLFLTGIAVVFGTLFNWNSFNGISSADTNPANFTIYDNQLQNGFINWSWNSNINLSDTSNPNEGSNDISFTVNGGWAGLYLHTDNGIDTTKYTALSFAAKASQNNQKYAVTIYDANNQTTHDKISLDNYGGQPSTSYKTYTIPLSDLNANSKTIKGIAIMDDTGNSQPALYIDSIQLVAAQTASPTSAPTTVTPTTTSVTPSTAPAVSSVPATSGSASNGSLSGVQFFNDQDANPATQQIQQWQSSRPNDAQALKKIADQPKATWLGNWNSNIQQDTKTKVDKASQANQVPVFIAYNIPGRDCGSYSSGGAGSSQAYESWIDGIASGIGSRKAVVIVEPDALAQDCLQGDALQMRYDLLKYAVLKLKSGGNTAVYLDAGHAGWIAADKMAQNLTKADIAEANGFALNVSNFNTTADSVSYGKQISALVSGKHFVIDTSRNGNGPATDNAWCNPSGRALGEKPTTQTADALIDAYLWLKYPGESDGSCNGGPSAGTWYPEYALGLAQNAKW